MPQELVDITDGVIDALASRSDVTTAFPVLFAQLVKAKRDVTTTKCGRCRKDIRSDLGNQYRRIKEAIVAMSPDRRTALKALIGSNKIRVAVGSTSAGVPVRHTL